MIPRRSRSRAAPRLPLSDAAPHGTVGPRAGSISSAPGQGRGGRCRRAALPALVGILAAVIAADTRAQGPAAQAKRAPPRATEALAPPAGGLDSPEGTLGYALGLQIGARMADDFRRRQAPLDFAALAQGLADALSGAEPRLPEERMRAALREFDERMLQEQEAFRRRMVEKGKINRAKATKFLAENAAKPGVKTTATGLQYEVLSTGQGPKPKPTDVVSAHYRGTHLDGTVFDESDPARGPLEFPLQAVVPGWQEALPMMTVGSKWRLWIPPELGYGEEGFPPGIEPNELLVFEIELVAIGPER